MENRAVGASTAQLGFTLLELLVALAIIGLIVAVATPRLTGFLSRAKSDTAELQVSNLKVAVDLYRLDVGRLPNSEEGLKALIAAPAGVKNWNGPYLDKDNGVVDPWGIPYSYRAPGEHGDFDIVSLGADGRQGGDGENRDIVSWSDG